MLPKSRLMSIEGITYDAPWNSTTPSERVKDNIRLWGPVVFACVGLLAVAIVFIAIYLFIKKIKNQSTKHTTIESSEFTVPIIQLPSLPSDGDTEVIQPRIDENLLNPDLYHYDYDECLPGSPYMGPSRLCFSVQYHESSENLKVTLIRATRLTPQGTNVTSTPYVKLCLLPDKRRKLQSRIQHRTSNPEFNEDFLFLVPKDELHTRMLKFTVCDFDRFSRQQVIGHVMFPLTDLELIMSTERNEIWMEISEDDTKPGNPKGDLLFCLQLLPTASRLTVAILKAKNLQLEGEYGELYPYVKVSMVMGGKICKKKKTGISKRANSPVYNEAFVFTIPPSCLEQVSFIISVINAPRLGGTKKLIGRCIVGPYMYSTGPGLAHWNDMLTSTRSAVAQWHSLI